MYKRILVPVDGSATADRGLAEAVALARQNDACLRLVHVVDATSFALGAGSFSGFGTDLLTLLCEGGQAILDRAANQAGAAGVPAETVLFDTLSGRVCDRVTEEAARWPADLIVIGTHGRRGAGRLLMGSDAEQILRLSKVPVLLVRGAVDAPPATRGSAKVEEEAAAQIA